MDPPRRTRARKYGFACLQCRRRKVKCDGRKPACLNCGRSEEICRYKVDSTYQTHLTEELRAQRSRVRELEDEIRRLAGLDVSSRERRLAELVAELDRRRPQDDRDNTSAPNSPPEGTEQQLRSTVEGICYDGGAHFSMDNDGRAQFFGATSRFHTFPDNSHVVERLPENKEPEHRVEEEYHRKWLTSNARFQDSWERLAYSNISEYIDVDPAICVQLLEVYWAWQAPLHNCVYRRCFYRDMALRGPYFSTFLLNVILAHACRHMPDGDTRFAALDRGEFFLQRAMLLLIDEMKQSKPRIPTIQGLLILGGRQCAVGRSSEGWLYTGMAIRMITDLGLHLRKSSTSLMKDFEPDDLEIRKRLYLSVYTWDKSISLCLGRPPSLREMPYPPSSLLDLSDDDDPWTPPLLSETEQIYTATKCHSTRTFKYFSELAEIINESYDTVYGGNTHKTTPNAILNLEKRLRTFHQQLPDSLRIDDVAELPSCIPPHILCLNILYHTMLILIFRPFFIWSWHHKLREHPLAQRAREVCIEQAAGVNEVFRVYGRMFNFQYQSYLISYCVYTAATIDVRLTRHDDRALAESAADRLVVTLRMLETEAKQTPGIRRSIEIIRSYLGQQQTWSLDPCLQDHAATVDDGARDSVGQVGNSVYGQMAETSVLSLPPLDGLDSSIDLDMQIDTSWIDWNADGSGGGFVPGMADGDQCGGPSWILH
ncbi:hypothetical protein BP00DRAFT_374036 [Aspergillus indologenus CBS 114.80]|uniref:Zn(2)-C6 fungal-type domain-containing protein n=1 Tax=Aspergillus indologenus CBS 114.80 TaxID=1450541 RepID=A0A2V5INI0_9EURO|nr:hypothetical protein BP00DRAFT_374036 [Aspergillus indologenus CBS 114.80]